MNRGLAHQISAKRLLVLHLCCVSACHENVIDARVWLRCHLAQVGLESIPGIVLGGDGFETLRVCLVHLTDGYGLVMPVHHTHSKVLLSSMLRIEHSVSPITLLPFDHRPASDMLIILLRDQCHRLFLLGILLGMVRLWLLL